MDARTRQEDYIGSLLTCASTIEKDKDRTGELIVKKEGKDFYCL